MIGLLHGGFGIINLHRTSSTVIKSHYMKIPKEHELPLRDIYFQSFPDGCFIDSSCLGDLEQYLQAQGWILKTEKLLSAERAGEGNMNLTLRLKTSSQSLILKQGRPWCEKYPTIPAPVKRSEVEALFYSSVRENDFIRGMMPSLIGSDPVSGVLVLEDLGVARDFFGLYESEVLVQNTLAKLLEYLLNLHEGFPASSVTELFSNREMKALNHEYIFQFPLQVGNGLDLDKITDGLAAAAAGLAGDVEFKKQVHELGQVYLADGEVLLHGDFFPGSWLKTEKGIRIIDPEFCFLGPREFDFGVLIAHLMLARQPVESTRYVLDFMKERTQVNPELALQFAGVEVMRRLIGIAQLPLTMGILEKCNLLTLAKRLVLFPGAYLNNRSH